MTKSIQFLIGIHISGSIQTTFLTPTLKNCPIAETNRKARISSSIGAT